VAGSVITLSSRVDLDELKRLVVARVKRDGVAPLCAVSSRQVRHLWLLAERLALDPGLEVYGSPHPDGITYMTVFAAGKRDVGWWGEPHTG
jgi:hypothetical protein